MKKISFLVVYLFVAITVFAQPKDLKKIAEIPTTPVKNQYHAGTCWDFATLSFIETETLRKTGKTLDLSENYIAYWAYVEKAQMYILKQGHHQFSQGGQAHDALNVISKYGIVTEDAYPYLKNHSELFDSLKTFLDTIISKETVEDWKQKYEQILDTFMGTPPKQFDYEGKNYRPQQFAKEVVQFNPDDYVELCSFTAHPYYKPFILEVADNWAMKEYYNLPLDELLKVMNYALQNGYSVAWDGDVSEKEFNPTTGIADIVVKVKSPEVKHEEMFMNLKTTDDHLMHITGLYKDKDGRYFYKTKNSWGLYGPYNGYMYMSEGYIMLKTIAILVNKKAIPTEIRKKLKI